MPDNEIRFGPFSLQNDPARLRRGAENIDLRPKSLEVLRYLVERPGQVVTKKELFRRVWSGRVVSDSGLRLCVREIRSALEDDATSPYYLETVTGHGYRFLEGRDGRAVLPDSTGPFVGREAELRQLEDCLQLATDGHLRFVLLSGEPGIGKTALLEVFLDRVAVQSTANVLKGQCVVHYGKGEAYGPLLGAIARIGHDKIGKEIIKMLTRFAPAWMVQIPGLLDPVEFEKVQRHVEGLTPERMTREFCQAIHELSKQTPLVLVIEDLHWADASTIDLLASLAQFPESSQLLLLGTYRPADAVLYATSLRDIVLELKGHGQCEEMSIELLSKVDVENYLKGRLGGEVAPGICTKVFERTNGNALFMVDLVEDLIRRQALVHRDSHWIVNDQAQALVDGMPESLRSLISRRLAALPDEQRRILKTASVAGVDFTSAAIASALERTVEEVDTLCESMSAQGQFIEATGVRKWPDGTLSGRYRFQHPMYFQVLYEDVGDSRKARLHQAIGERLESAYVDRRKEIAAALAMHFNRSRDMNRAIFYGKLTADQALNRHAYHEAISQLEDTLGLIEQLPQTNERDQQELHLLSLLGPAQIAMGGYTTPEVEHTFSRAQALCEQLEDKASLAATLWNLAGFRMGRAELTQSRSLIEQCIEVTKATPDSDLDLMVHDALAQQLFFEGEFVSAKVYCEHVASRYDPGRYRHLAQTYSQEDPGVVCASIDALILWLLGFRDQSLGRMQDALSLSKELGNPHSAAFCRFFTGIMWQLQRDPPATLEQANEQIRISTEYDIAQWILFGDAVAAWATTQQEGADAEHLARITTALAEWRGAGVGLAVPYMLGLLAGTQQASGQIEDAQASVAEALSLIDKSGERWFEAELHRLQGELALEQDGKQQADAEQCFARSIEVARGQGARSLELRAALSLCRLWVRQSQPDKARKLLKPIYASFSEGLETGDLQAARSLLDELA